MAETATKLPVKTEETAAERSAAIGDWRPFEGLRQEINRLFDDLGADIWRSPFRRSLFDIEPFWRRELSWSAFPAVDIVDKEKVYEITAELPGMDDKNIEITLSNGVLTINGEKTEEKEEKKKDYYRSERHYGSFRRSFQLPAGVDAEKIEASFKKGVLTLTLPKAAEAQKPDKKIPIAA
jgi:HSP20 family protein